MGFWGFPTPKTQNKTKIEKYPKKPKNPKPKTKFCFIPSNHTIVNYHDLLGLPESLADLPAMALECALDGKLIDDVRRCTV